MLAMYLAYRLFLARDNQHSFNRGILLLIYLVSFAATPVIHYLDRPDTHPATQAPNLENLDVIGTVVTSQLTQPIWGSILIWIFLIGMIVVAISTITTWVSLANVIRSGEKIERNGYTLIIIDNDRFAPFSWMHYIVMSRNDIENSSAAVTTHEMKHITSRHWIDLLIAQAVCIINWFNPAAWLMRDELMLVHEYQADEAVITGGHDPQEYQMLLVKKAVGARFPSLANSLNHSKLKKRITMMYKNKSGAGHKAKALALVPMLALAFGVATVPAVRAAVYTISSSDISVNKDSEKQSADKTDNQSFTVTDFYDDGKNTMIVIHGKNVGNNMTVSGGTFSTTGQVYHATSLNSDMTNGAATIVSTFPVSFSGEHKDPAMSIIVNGKEVSFNLKDAIKKGKSAQRTYYGVLSIDSDTTMNISPVVLSVSDKMDIYLDGRKISTEEMKTLSNDNIAQITIDKQNNAIKITSKK